MNNLASTLSTPESLRLHIGIFGKANSGKSSLLNALTGEKTAIVSEKKGTTTDSVKKAVELDGVGPVVFIDTAGFDDATEIGQLRLEKTSEALKKIDIAIIVFSADTFDFSENDIAYIAKIKNAKKPIIPVLNKIDKINENEIENYKKRIFDLLETFDIITTSTMQDTKNIDQLQKRIRELRPRNFFEKTSDFTKNLCAEGDTVVLVMPQDSQAPKGRLIFAQVQIIRELLDKKCVTICCVPENFSKTLSNLKNSPKLIITDSQVFDFVAKNSPKNVLLTSFSILMATQKGDISQFLLDTKKIKNLPENARFLIAEICLHHVGKDDIGKVKIPRLIKKHFPNAKIDFARGQDFPVLTENGEKKYDCIIHCGACMVNAEVLKNRQKQAKDANVLMTNYGLAIAYFSGILDAVTIF